MLSSESESVHSERIDVCVCARLCCDAMKYTYIYSSITIRNKISVELTFC